ncbi:hypothetical protein ES332_A03G087700v1 [Gossypium tomentosum]|uniref:malate dehydrogenase n=1 Tax=Gossypium tomentosum TaxID=34277 RepID=A0A5D2R7B1_GOSTO|nr:hypothetical protein ES332_A03G087700v1 [Gossypium tomentosum]
MATTSAATFSIGSTVSFGRRGSPLLLTKPSAAGCTSQNSLASFSGLKAATSVNCDSESSFLGKESSATLRGSFTRKAQKPNQSSNHGLQLQASYKVAILGAAGGIGQPLALLIKMSPLVSALNLYDIANVKGVAADLSHCNTPSQVLDFTGASEIGNCLKGVNVVVIPAGVPRKPGGHAGITILPLLSKTKPSVSFTDEEVEQLTVRIQNAGTEVVEAKAGAGSATLSMAYAAARFVESSLRALDGDGDVYECSFVQSDLTDLPFFASRVKLGRKGIEAMIPSDLQGLSEYEEKALEALKPELKASIEKGIAFAQKQPVTA